MSFTRKIFFLFFALPFLVFSQNNFRLGCENLLAEKSYLIKNKNLALVINQTSVLPNGTYLLDTLINAGFAVKKIFALEHGVSGKKAPGETVENSFLKNIHAISLYGKKKAPEKNDLQGIDAIVYDIQDVGTRFYTYITSLKLIIESAAKNGVEIIVLDRPNPQGNKIEGEILDSNFFSFVGAAEIPVVYGMTIGELAHFFAEEISKEKKIKPKLTIVPMDNYSREENYFSGNNHALKWKAPSPNLRTFDAARLYPGLCFLEATNVSEGRGSDFPFEQFGAPFINSEKLISVLNKTDFKRNLEFLPVKFLPSSDGKFATKFAGKLCSGVRIKILNYDFNSVTFGVKLLKILTEMYPDEMKFNYNRLAMLYGNRNLEKYIKGEIDYSALRKKWKTDREKFEIIRSKYLLYEK